MIEEIVGLGFKRIELSHGIRISLVPGILRALEENLIEISSVHNFCPLPSSVQYAAPNLFQPSALDSRERSLWRRYTEQTLDFAVKVGTERIIMHSGSAWFFFGSPEAKLDKWIERSGLKATELAENATFKKRRGRAMKRIESASVGAMERINAGYGVVISMAKERGLQLCLENREGMEEMPLDADYHEFLEDLSEPKHVAYWHDTGHAQVKHQLGLLDHREHLATMADRLAGFHLHDVSEEGRDHQVPGTGTVDFNMVAEFVRPEHTLVLELSPMLSVDEVKASRDYIGQLLA
jgi:sugar phosphate isomerase/epimerase